MVPPVNHIHVLKPLRMITTLLVFKQTNLTLGSFLILSVFNRQVPVYCYTVLLDMYYHLICVFVLICLYSISCLFAIKSGKVKALLFLKLPRIPQGGREDGSSRSFPREHCRGSWDDILLIYMDFKNVLWYILLYIWQDRCDF